MLLMKKRVVLMLCTRKVIFTFLHGGVQSIAVSMSVCLSVKFQEPHTKRDSFLYMLPVAMTRSSSDDTAVYYVLLLLWMMSNFHIMGHIRCMARLTSEGC